MQNRSKETRARILKAALDLFSQSGYEASGVAEICRAAGVSKGAFYHHVPSKQELFLELLRTWLDALDVELIAARVEAKDIPQALGIMVGLMRTVFQQASGYLPMFLEFWTQAHRDHAIWKEVIAPYRRYQKLFSSMIQEGIAEGSLQEVDPELVSRAIVSLAVGLLLQGVMDPQDADWGQVSLVGIQLMLKGIEIEAK